MCCGSNALLMGFHERVALAACFSGYLIVLHLGEVLGRISGVDLSWIFRLSLPFSFVKFTQAPSGLWVTWGGVLWHLGTILWHIHGFSTDTEACMFLREPQHVTAIGDLADSEAYPSLCFLLLIDLGPSTEPGVAAVLVPGLLLSSGV